MVVRSHDPSSASQWSGGGAKPETQAVKAKRLIYRVPNQKGIAEGQSRWFYRACVKGFGAEGGGQPEGGLPGWPPWRGGADHDGEGGERVGADDAQDGMRSALVRDEEKAGVEDGDNCA